MKDLHLTTRVFLTAVWVCGVALSEAGTREQTLQTELETLKEEKAEADEYLSEFEAASIEETGALEADKAKLQVPTAPNTSWQTTVNCQPANLPS